MAKKTVTVTAEHNWDGKIKPLSITWEDGRVFIIDRIMDVRLAATPKMSGKGLRYTCRICGKQVYLFHDLGQWYIER